MKKTLFGCIFLLYVVLQCNAWKFGGYPEWALTILGEEKAAGTVELFTKVYEVPRL
jgi:hypothetical protein